MAEKRPTCVKRQDAFLAAFAKHGSILAAARAVKISRETVRIWRRDDPAFAERFLAQKLDLIELLEDGAVDDAMGEWNEKKKRYFGGNPILKIFLLKGLAPEKYRDHFKLEHGGEIKTNPLIPALAAMTKAELKKLVESE
jgi:hypothetical protein